MRIKHAAILLAGLAMTSGAEASSMLDGVWGGPGVLLTVGPDGSAVLQQDCASGRFGPVRIAKAGTFRVRGNWEEYGPGPQPADVPPAQGSATFQGHVRGDTLTLTIARSGHPRQSLTLLKGKRAKLIRCL